MSPGCTYHLALIRDSRPWEGEAWPHAETGQFWSACRVYHRNATLPLYSTSRTNPLPNPFLQFWIFMDPQLSIFNATQLQPTYVTWEPEPTRRGTFNILSTCLTTLAFCVWSSVHIDVVDNKRNAFLQKLLWLFVDLLAPEILLITYSQRRLASKLMTEANEHFHPPEEKPRDQESRSWKRLKERAQTRNNKVLWSTFGDTAAKNLRIS